MRTVPKNKTVYVGRRKYCAGEALPPFIILNEPEIENEKINNYEKPRRQHPSKRFSV